jgi:hypothetical protein
MAVRAKATTGQLGKAAINGRRVNPSHGAPATSLGRYRSSVYRIQSLEVSWIW